MVLQKHNNVRQTYVNIPHKYARHNNVRQTYNSILRKYDYLVSRSDFSGSSGCRKRTAPGIYVPLAPGTVKPSISQ